MNNEKRTSDKTKQKKKKTSAKHQATDVLRTHLLSASNFCQPELHIISSFLTLCS